MGIGRCQLDLSLSFCRKGTILVAEQSLLHGRAIGFPKEVRLGGQGSRSELGANSSGWERKGNEMGVEPGAAALRRNLVCRVHMRCDPSGDTALLGLTSPGVCGGVPNPGGVWEHLGVALSALGWWHRGDGAQLGLDALGGFSNLNPGVL